MDHWNKILKNRAELINNGYLIYSDSNNKTNLYELFKHILQVGKIDKFKKILHFGCGSGTLGKYFINEYYNYTGVDSSLNMINKFKKLLNFEDVYTINSNKLPFEDNSFDLVFCSSFTQYFDSVDDFKLLINEFIRVSKTMIYIGDLSIIDKKYIETFGLKYKIIYDSLFCTTNSRYNCIINKNNYVYRINGKKL